MSDSFPDYRGELGRAEAAEVFEGRCFTCRTTETRTTEDGLEIRLDRGLSVQFAGQVATTPGGVTVAMGPCPNCGDRVMLVLDKPHWSEEGDE